MEHLVPILAVLVVTALVTDRGLAALRAGAGALVTMGRGLVEYLRALGRWYARLAFGPSGR